MENTPIQFLDTEQENALYIKRDDLIPYSFGGNKARKACLFFEEIDKGAYDCVVTYGSSHSNHCRIVSNMAAARGKKCYLIGPEEVSDTTFNSKLMQCFGAEIITVPVENVHETIEEQLHKLKKSGKKPYFIPGGGHGNLGTQAYVNCYNEIKEYEKANHIFFEYIFFASGTGTTQAGLICGQIENADNDRKIIGISIARRNPRGRNVVVDSVEEYMGNCNKEKVENNTIFIDNYIGHGYGKENEEIEDTIRAAMVKYGIPLDSTYTGKAFQGMKKYIAENNIKNKNILFIPDQNLGKHIAELVPSKNFLFCNGYCPTHYRITPEDILTAKEKHPGAPVLIHPECKPECVELADYAGSTSGIIDYATNDREHDEFIVVTEIGVIHEMEKRNPGKKFYPATDKLVCPNMKKNTLEKVRDCLKNNTNQVELDEEFMEKAKKPLERMHELAK